MDFRNVSLELSLKPFRDPTEDAVRAVCRRLFEQWAALIRRADQVSVLLWIADGSEILDYAGNLDEPIEWARYIGLANPQKPVPGDPDGVCLHSRPYLYMDDPPELTFGWLKRLTQIIREVGVEVTGKPTRVGATFDPGGEFAVSPFKYERHREVCLGDTMGKNSWVCCYGALDSDDRAYAGFPDGIPQDTPFGTFFGRQCRHFLGDLGFDYIWLSNGFGFGLDTWSLRGALFDGETFDTSRAAEVREKVIGFWRAFRAECPDVPVETRGTNLSTGIDLSSDGSPLRDIYRGGFGMEPPPNSPWAALNGDFGLELVGWMSRIAELPADGYPFRFYTHDPWWLNSPWLDRYGREAHDILLPLSIARIDSEGNVCPPTAIDFLTCDDSYGRIPDRVPNEVIPHILECRDRAPDAPGPLVWVYPFDEYHDWTFGEPSRIGDVFFGDWFMRGAVNCGLPLNTVVSTRNLVTAREAKPGLFRESILVSPVPDEGTPWAAALLDHVRTGGRALLYGPLRHAGGALLEALNVVRAGPLSGEFETAPGTLSDRLLGLLLGLLYPETLVHHELLSAGGLEACVRDAADPHTRALARARQNGAERVVATARSVPEWNGGTLAWVRGTVSCDPERLTRGHLLVPLDPEETFPGEMLMRLALVEFGYELLAEKQTPSQRSPMLTVSRHRNGFFLSGYSPNTTLRSQLRFPQGAPLLLGFETELVAGRTTYTMPRAWRRECRVFVEQARDTELSCVERHSGEIGVSRRFFVGGLRDATVRFYPEPGTETSVRMLRDPVFPYVQGDFVEPRLVDDALGRHLVAEGISGGLLISW